MISLTLASISRFPNNSDSGTRKENSYYFWELYYGILLNLLSLVSSLFPSVGQWEAGKLVSLGDLNKDPKFLTLSVTMKF